MEREVDCLAEGDIFIGEQSGSKARPAGGHICRHGGQVAHCTDNPVGFHGGFLTWTEITHDHRAGVLQDAVGQAVPRGVPPPTSPE